MYAEETSRPHILVPRVMFLAVGGVAVFFALSSWALTVATGPSAVVAESQKQSAGLLFGLTESRLGGTFTDVLHVLFVTGMFAAMLSFHNVVARYAFAMGREGLLPAAFGRTNSASGAPGTGSLLQTAVSVVVVVIFAVADDKPTGDPTEPVLHLFTWFGNIGALGVIVLMAAASASVIVFFVRRGAAGAQAWRLVTSALGIALLVIMRLHGEGLRRPGRRGPGLLAELGAPRHHRPRPAGGPGPGPPAARPQARGARADRARQRGVPAGEGGRRGVVAL